MNMQIDESALDQLKALIGDDQEALMELIESFIADGRNLVASMTQACETQDTQNLHRSAHTLKSGAADFGARHLATLCAALESACHSDWPQDAVERVDEICQEYAKSEQALQTFAAR